MEIRMTLDLCAGASGADTAGVPGDRHRPTAIAARNTTAIMIAFRRMPARLVSSLSLRQLHKTAGVFVALSCVVAGGCGAGEARVYDFAAELGQAAVRQETRWIDLGEPFAREFLL